MKQGRLREFYTLLGGWIEHRTGNRIDGALHFPTWCILMRPLFCFLCDVLSSHPVIEKRIEVTFLTEITILRSEQGTGVEHAERQAEGFGGGNWRQHEMCEVKTNKVIVTNYSGKVAWWSL